MILGPSGSGKSVLLRRLAAKPSSALPISLLIDADAALDCPDLETYLSSLLPRPDVAQLQQRLQTDLQSQLLLLVDFPSPRAAVPEGHFLWKLLSGRLLPKAGLLVAAESASGLPDLCTTFDLMSWESYDVVSFLSAFGDVEATRQPSLQLLRLPRHAALFALLRRLDREAVESCGVMETEAELWDVLFLVLLRRFSADRDEVAAEGCEAVLQVCEPHWRVAARGEKPLPVSGGVFRFHRSSAKFYVDFLLSFLRSFHRCTCRGLCSQLRPQ